MIDLTKIKAILAFYLDTKRTEWRLVNGETITYPLAKTTEREKLSYICKLLVRLEGIAKKKLLTQKTELIELCKLLRTKAEEEAKAHKSSRAGGLARHITNYPALSKVLLGIVSYCMDYAVGADFALTSEKEILAEIEELKKKEQESQGDEKATFAEQLENKKAELVTFKEINFHKLKTGKQGDDAGFVDILLYEDYNYGARSYQHINSFDDFINQFTTKENCFLLLDTLTQMWRDDTTLRSDVSVVTVSLLANKDKEKQPSEDTEEKEISMKGANRI